MTDGTWTYTWRNGRELATMSNGTTTWSYTYDANGMRTSRTNGTKTYNYVYNGSQLTQMTVGNDTLYFTYGVLGPNSVTWNGTTYYYSLNLQGDVAGIFDDDGKLVVIYNWDNAWGYNPMPEGSLANTLGTLNPLRYRGYVYDVETGFYYLQSRYYDPEIGRFINADAFVTIGGLLGNNMFAYCVNNPNQFSDPTGTSPYDSYISYESGAELGGTYYFIAAGLATTAIVVGPGFIDNLADTLSDFEDWIEDQKQAIVSKLEASLARAKPRRYQSETETHHIAAKESSNAKIAAAVLAKVFPDGVESPLNKIEVTTSVHRRIHTYEYYTFVNCLVICAFYEANGDPSQEYDNVVAVLGYLRAFITVLNGFSIN